MSQKPVHEVRLGVVKAAIFKNETEGGAIRYGVSIVKLYKDEAEKWQQTKSFGRDDLPLVSRVADLAFLWCHQQSQEAQKESVAA